MRYFIRSVKYFLYLAVLCSLLMAVLILTKFVPADINQIFGKGWVSVAEIGGLFIVFAGLYPKIGYAKRMAALPGEWAEVAGKVRTFMAERDDYVEEIPKNGNAGEEKVCYRAKKMSTRIARTWEDRITFTPTFGGVNVEGPAKDVARLVSAIEYRYRQEEQ